MSTKPLTDASFDSTVSSTSKPILVDFWASWCGPCRAIAPALEEISDELSGKLEVVKVDVDENSAVPARFGVRSIPTLIILKDGKLLGSKVGSAPKAELRQWIDSILETA